MHTKTIKILTCENEQKPELGLSHDKRELRSTKTKSSLAGAMFMKRKALESEL